MINIIILSYLIVSQIALVFFLPLIGKVRKRPLWLGVSNCFAAVGIFIIALPHFICELTVILQANCIDVELTCSITQFYCTMCKKV